MVKGQFRTPEAVSKLLIIQYFANVTSRLTQGLKSKLAVMKVYFQ